MRKVGTKETQVSSSRHSLGRCGNEWMEEGMNMNVWMDGENQ